MTPARRIASLPIIGAALVLLAFGIVRGASSAGPGHGTRLLVNIDPPVDAAALAMAEHVARGRLAEKAAELRIVPAADGLVIELGEQDPELVRGSIELLERTATFGLHRFTNSPVAGELVVDGHAIERAEVLDRGVAITANDAAALARVSQNETLGVVLDGTFRFVVTADRVVGTELHLATKDANAARDLLHMIEAGAVHPMHVVEHQAFTRATGFWPRAWLFLALGAVLLVVAALVGWRRAPTPA